MKTWEHRAVYHRSPETVVSLMDEAGAEGWEVIGVVFHPEGKIVAFMRRETITEEVKEPGEIPL